MTHIKLPISTVLLVKNSIETLPAYFAAMDFVDDIVVLDGYSTDGSKEYATQFENCTVHDQPLEFLDENKRIQDFGGLRTYGDTLTKHPWIVVVDSDETIDAECKKSVEEVIKNNKPGLYYVKIQRKLGDQKIYTAFPSKQVRLFHKEAVTGWIKKVHERLQPIKNAHIGEVEGYLECDCEDNTMKKNMYYIDLELKNLRKLDYKTWFYWVLWFNTKAIGFEIFRTIVNRVTPKKGARLPLTQTLLFIHYHAILTVKTFPWLRNKQLSKVTP